MDDAAYRSLPQRFADDGFDTSLFKHVSQTPDQVGKPGFQ
jgi:apolipoprotein D and lipocalin family protein